MQTSYLANPLVGIEGMKIEDYPSAIITGLAEGATIKVGVACAFDTTSGRHNKAVRAVAAAADITGAVAAGITLWDPTYPFDDGDYKRYASLPVMRKGRVYVLSETAQVKGTHPYVRVATGAASVLGKIRNTADTVSSVDTATQAPWITVLETITAAGLVMIEVNL